MKQAYYCIQENASQQYVERLTFTGDRVSIDFTGDREKAAVIRYLSVAKHLAACVPGGVARKLFEKEID